MKRIMGFVFVITGFLVASVFAGEKSVIALEQPSAIVAAPIVPSSLCPTSSEKITVARQGCCSWHDGVCGCSYGRVVCCDGSYSPSCTCNHDDMVDEDKTIR